MRKRWIWDATLKELVPVEDYTQPSAGFFVRGDLQPYQSQKTGEMIEGRAAHREHLKRHNLVEIGDAWDKGAPQPKQASRSEEIRQTVGRIVYEKLRYT